MYILTSTGVTSFAIDWVEHKGIEHLCNCHFPAETECWIFSEQDYEDMGSPDFSAIDPDGAPEIITIGKIAWKKLHPELFDDYVAPKEEADGSESESDEG